MPSLSKYRVADHQKAVAWTGDAKPARRPPRRRVRTREIDDIGLADLDSFQPQQFDEPIEFFLCPSLHPGRKAPTSHQSVKLGCRARQVEGHRDVVGGNGGAFEPEQTGERDAPWGRRSAG